MYNMHESNFSPMCVCVFGGGGGGGFSIILSFYPRKLSRREFEFGTIMLSLITGVKKSLANYFIANCRS